MNPYDYFNLLDDFASENWAAFERFCLDKGVVVDEDVCEELAESINETLEDHS